MSSQPRQYNMVADSTTDAKPHRRGHAPPPVHPDAHPPDAAARQHRAQALKAKASDRNLSWYDV